MKKASVPIKKISSIEYVHDYTKGDNVTGTYCGQACIAMLTGRAFHEIIRHMSGECEMTKRVLKKYLDYYGIRYAEKSISIKKAEKLYPETLPEICILRMIIADENGEFKFKKGNGHWGIFYKGKFYDPDYGVHEKCPPQVKVFQVWEIYS